VLFRSHKIEETQITISSF